MFFRCFCTPLKVHFLDLNFHLVPFQIFKSIKFKILKARTYTYFGYNAKFEQLNSNSLSQRKTLIVKYWLDYIRSILVHHFKKNWLLCMFYVNLFFKIANKLKTVALNRKMLELSKSSEIENAKYYPRFWTRTVFFCFKVTKFSLFYALKSILKFRFLLKLLKSSILV